jgi:guanylate kinase
MTNKKTPLLVVIHGPSGVGKDSVINQLIKEPNIRRAITTTTRLPRKNEKNGSDYYFITQSEFEKQIQNGNFIEHAQVYEDLKGLETQELQRCIAAGGTTIIRTDLQGAKFWRTLSGKIIIILLTLEESLLRERLRARGSETTLQLEKRLAKAQEEQALSDLNNYVILNPEGQLTSTITTIKNIIRTEEQKTTREKHQEEFEDFFT